MPILEAGLIGMPIFSTDIPATVEIGGREVNLFSEDALADQVANLILEWSKNSPAQRLRQRVRDKFTWQAIFKNDFLPLLSEGATV
jgi:glycosyltransferase involved in cell wall biosynthesis